MYRRKCSQVINYIEKNVHYQSIHVIKNQLMTFFDCFMNI
ncbi:hypothetical protein NBRC111894_400 [Sporolactobacillus inulinus]|uniref:Uncharacterized protein n=1 Tax=Sporolactobacillus inulinus TaxID=2078 RepID=A0A4Y1Z7D4_9BACL|nr:hypothetical protein NBRC111894_400 [Sporolactobacillus inulinus]